MANLKPWYRVDGCQPREDLRLNKPLNEADFAVNLDHIKRGDSHPDYVQPHLFFARTFMTKALRELAAGTVRRLAGEQSETAAVYNMATQFGGGKTHALAMLYHLANGGPSARDWAGVAQILTDAGVKEVPKAATAVVVGTEFDPISGRQDGNGPVRKTLWGEIAWQLGGEKSFAVVAEHEAKGVAPGGDVIRNMLPNGPALILLDELVNFMSRSRKVDMRGQVMTFIFNLAETVRAMKGVVLCVSVPKSLTTEITSDDEADYTMLKHELDRIGKAIMMSADVEIAEIIRRRLFEWSSLPREGELAAQEYAAWVKSNAGALSGIDPDRAYEQFKASYPFHPSALSVFQRKWQSLPRFQRTRGVLRLLAMWVARAFQEDHREQFPDIVIGLGSAPLEDPKFRAAVFEQLGSADLEGPATTDIAGGANAHAIRLDKESTEAIKKARLHQKSATAIFFESNGGQNKGEASLGEVKAAVAGPNVNLADVDHALEGLVGSCYYLTLERNRYRFSVTPNVNKILNDRRAAVPPKQIDDLLRKDIEKLFSAKPQGYELDLRAFPERSNDIPDRPILTVVVLHPERSIDAAGTRAFIDTVMRECGTAQRLFKGALVFLSADSITPLRDAARDVLAWREIDEDEQTKSRLDDSQRKQLLVQSGSAKKTLEEAIWRAYRHVHLLDSQGDLELVDLGNVTRSQAPTPLANVFESLSKVDKLTDAPSHNKLLKWWPPALTAWPTKGVRDAFFSTPQLTRLKQPGLVRRTISDGVSRGDIGYARKGLGDNLQLLAFKEHLPESDVEISDEVVILKAEDAKKLLEPPRLARIQLSPGGTEVAPGEAVAFSVTGTSQYGEAFEAEAPSWSATGGTVDQSGKFVAGEESGLFSVTAKCGAVESHAQIRVKLAGSPPLPPPPPGGQMFLWSGEVPAQKWMNFYTKVLTKFASSPGLRLNVSFEVPRGDIHAQEKAAEARAALRELGLNDEINEG